ncbi:Golgi SNAP receptor complex member 1 [Rhizophlyctis rosea]|nr:Golgi SNAP receptor complex member 1 [Rhizophlyctis rosea]
MAYRSQYAPVPPQPPSLHPLTQPPPGSSAAAAQTATAASWDTLRRQARTLENEIEAKLVAYSRIGSGAAGGDGGYGGGGSAGYGVGGGSVGWHSAQVAEMELEELLKKLTWVVNSMATAVDTAGPANSNMMHMLQRHRDILYDYSKDFNRTKSNIAQARNHAELLTSIRDDISTYRSGTGTDMQSYLLTERGKIDGTHRMADIPSIRDSGRAEPPTRLIVGNERADDRSVGDQPFDPQRGFLP